MRTLITVFVCSLFVGCGPYEGGDPRSQHEDGVSSQASLDGTAVVSPEPEERERAQRLAKEQDRQRREEARHGADEAKAEQEAEAGAEAEPVAQPEGTDSAAAVPGVPGEAVEPAELSAAEAVVDAIPPLPELELEGNLAALIAEEENRLAASEVLAPETEDGAPAPAVQPSARPDAPAGAPVGSVPAVDGSEAMAAAHPAPPDVAVPAFEGDAALATENTDPASIPAVASNGSLPPCDPNDLAAVALRDLTLKQTFGEGESARAVLTSSGGSEYVVGKGSVVGPAGARVVRVSPGELILAEIQFDMGGAPVMVQKALRMDLPR